MSDKESNTSKSEQQDRAPLAKHKPLVSDFRVSPFDLWRFALTVFVLGAIFGILTLATLLHLTS